MIEFNDETTVLDAIDVYIVVLVEGVDYEGETISNKLITRDREMAIATAQRLAEEHTSSYIDYSYVEVNGMIMEVETTSVRIARFEKRTHKNCNERVNTKKDYRDAQDSEDWLFHDLAQRSCSLRKRVTGQFNALPSSNDKFH